MRPLDGDEFVEILTGFVQLMDEWRKTIAAYVPIAEAEAETETEQKTDLDLTGFMQV